MTENKQDRNMWNIANIVEELIPKTELEFYKEMNKFIYRLNFKAPEIINGAECWEELTTILNNYISEIKEDWQIKIRDIVNDIPREDTKHKIE